MHTTKSHTNNSKPIKIKSLLFSCSLVSDSLQPYGPVAGQAPLSMGFPRQGYWNGFLFPSLGVFQTQGSNLLLLLGRWIFFSPLSHQEAQNKVRACIIRKNRDDSIANNNACVCAQLCQTLFDPMNEGYSNDRCIFDK